MVLSWLSSSRYFWSSFCVIVSSRPSGSDRRVLTSYEVRHHIKTTKAEFFIAEPELLDTVLKASHEGGIPADKIVVFNVRNAISPTGV
jgi:hypothetical protein